MDARWPCHIKSLILYDKHLPLLAAEVAWVASIKLKGTCQDTQGPSHAWVAEGAANRDGTICMQGGPESNMSQKFIETCAKIDYARWPLDGSKSEIFGSGSQGTVEELPA